MEKYSVFRGRAGSGAPHVHLIEPSTGYGLDKTASLRRMGKTAEHLPGVQELVEAIEPQPDRLYLLNSSLAAGEVAGFNLRGDWFDESGLVHEPPGWNDIPVWDIDARRRAANQTEKVAGWGDLSWGHPTFYNAHRYRHHVNKDPNRAYGYVLGSFWDPRMKRVILVSELIREMCSRLGALDIYERIARGDFPDTSMGSKVPFDTCSICGHQARSPKNYCEHVNNQNPRYGMGKLLPDGRMCGVYNPYPRFFDDSFVFVGAERSAKVMSNLTDQVKGDRPYSQTVHVFIPAVRKVAEAPPSEREEEASDLHNAYLEAITQQRMPDATLEEKLTRVVAGVPVNTPAERAAMRYFVEKRVAENKLQRALISKAELDLWDQLTRQQIMREHGDAMNIHKGLDDTIGQRLQQFFGVKTAATTKWGDILKQIPLPADRAVGVIKEYSNKLPPVPKAALEECSQHPGQGVRAMARMGIVLTPEEFQYIMLRRQHPEMAQELRRKGEVFSPAPIDMEKMPAFRANDSIPEEVLQKVMELVSPVLAERSFAPRILRVQITREIPSAKKTPPKFTENTETLKKVAELYNEYRGGLLVETPDFRHVPSVGLPQVESLEDEIKVAESAQTLSNLLMCLAYWPSLP